LAVEVKNSKVVSPSDLRGLKEFYKDYPEASLLFLYRGKEIFKRDGILCIPVDLFLSQMNPLSPELKIP